LTHYSLLKTNTESNGKRASWD